MLFWKPLLIVGEYSGRGVDLHDPEDFVPLSELISSLPDKLMLVPVALFALVIAYVVFGRRKSIPTNESWFGIYNEDKGWEKTGLIICWIAFVIGLVPIAWTLVNILWRVIVGGTLTFVSWLFQIIISIIVILVFIGLVPFVLYSILVGKNKGIAITLSSISLVVAIYFVIYFWNIISDWPFMFPSLIFDL